MRKSILWVFATLLLAAVGCKKDAPQESVSFETSIPVVIDGVATINVISSYAGSQAVTVPIKFAGTAVKGTDYKVSTEAFVLGGANPVKSVQVTPLVFGSKKTVSMSLEVPSGFMTGNYPMVQFPLSEKLGYVSFEKKSVGMTDQVDLNLTLVDEHGKVKKVERETEVELVLDKEKSSAVEGVNFEVVGGLKAVFPAGESRSKITLKQKKYEEGKDLIVLNIAENAKFSDGQYVSTKVKLLGGIESLIAGEWKVKSFSPDKENILISWGYDLAKLKGYPELDPEDSFTIDVVENKFIPAFKSEFKNYFIGESSFKQLDLSWYPVKKGEPTKKMSFDVENRNIDVDRFMFTNINRNFDPVQKSEDKEGVVGFSVKENADKSLTLLLVLMDYKPTYFNHPAFEFLDGCSAEPGRKKGDKPVAHEGGVAIIMECVRK